MNDTTHTPGPWTLEQVRSVATDAVLFRLFGPGRRCIGMVGVGTEVRHKQTADRLPLEEARANALAMHAVPELLAELRRLTMVSSGGFTGCVVCNNVTEAGHREGCSLNAAILKATGGRP